MCFAWIDNIDNNEALPASLSGLPPQSLIDAGTPTNFVQVLDMALLLPAFAITAVNLWNKRPLGYGGTADGDLVGLFAVSLGILIVYLRNLRSSPPQ